MTVKLESYQAEAERCRRMAAEESCPDAREYYEALQRDYIKLLAKELREHGNAASTANKAAPSR